MLISNLLEEQARHLSPDEERSTAGRRLSAIGRRNQ